MRKYMTIQGDMWDGIAKKIYGDETYMNALLEANPAYLSIVVFSSGLELNVPEITIPKTTHTPPWKE
jgi:phage tail protein X